MATHRYIVLMTLVCMVSLLLCTGVFASNIYSQSYSTQRSNNAGNPYTEYDSMSDLSNFNTIVAEGDRPIVCDIDNDNVKELLIFSKGDTQIRVFNGEGNVVTEETTLDIQTGFTVDDAVCVNTLDNTENRLLLFTHSGTSTYIAEYNVVSGVLDLTDLKMNVGDDTLVPESNVECSEYTYTGDTTYMCAYVPENTAYTHVVITNEGSSLEYVFFVANNTNERAESITSTAKGSTYYQVAEERYNRVLPSKFGSSFYYATGNNGTDNRGTLWKASWSDCAYSGAGGHICTANYEHYTPVPAYTDPVMGEIMSLDYNGVEYICISQMAKQAPNGRVSIECVNEDMSSHKQVVNRYEGSFGSSTAQGYMFFELSARDINDDYYEELCYTYAVDYAFEVTGAGCYDLKNTVSLGTIYSATRVFPDYQNFLFSGTSAGTPTLVLYNTRDDTILEYDVTNLSSYTNLSLAGLTGYTLLDDIGGDGTPEIISVGGVTNSQVVFLNGISAPSVTTYGAVIYNYYDPACTNTTKTFKMKECQDTLDCTYTSSSPDESLREQLCTSCDGTQSYHCGAFSYTNPQVTCTNMTTPGEYEITIDMYSDVYAGAYVDTFTITDFTIASSSCDQAKDFIDIETLGGGTTPDVNTTGTGGTTTTEEVGAFEQFWNTLLAGNDSPLIRFLLAIFIIVSFVGGTYRMTHGQASNFLYLIAVAGGVITSIVVELISIYFGVLGIVVLGLIAYISMKKTTDG